MQYGTIGCERKLATSASVLFKELNLFGKGKYILEHLGPNFIVTL